MSDWSQLIDTPIGVIARTYHDIDSNRYYHNWIHIQRLLWHAETTLHYAYDPNLDLAIMFHDSIYDSHPNKELRSANLFMTVYDGIGPISGVDPDIVYQLIMDTERHENVRQDERMICLDLADLSDSVQTEINHQLILDESMALYGITQEQFAQNSIPFMQGLKSRVKNNRDISNDPTFWDAVENGIDQTIALNLKLLP